MSYKKAQLRRTVPTCFTKHSNWCQKNSHLQISLWYWFEPFHPQLMILGKTDQQLVTNKFQLWTLFHKIKKPKGIDAIIPPKIRTKLFRNLSQLKRKKLWNLQDQIKPEYRIQLWIWTQQRCYRKRFDSLFGIRWIVNILWIGFRQKSLRCKMRCHCSMNWLQQ